MKKFMNLFVFMGLLLIGNNSMSMEGGDVAFQNAVRNATSATVLVDLATKNRGDDPRLDKIEAKAKDLFGALAYNQGKGTPANVQGAQQVKAAITAARSAAPSETPEQKAKREAQAKAEIDRKKREQEVAEAERKRLEEEQKKKRAAQGKQGVIDLTKEIRQQEEKIRGSIQGMDPDIINAVQTILPPAA